MKMGGGAVEFSPQGVGIAPCYQVSPDQANGVDEALDLGTSQCQVGLRLADLFQMAFKSVEAAALRLEEPGVLSGPSCISPVLCQGQFLFQFTYFPANGGYLSFDVR